MKDKIVRSRICTAWHTGREHNLSGSESDKYTVQARSKICPCVPPRTRHRVYLLYSFLRYVRPNKLYPSWFYFLSQLGLSTFFLLFKFLTERDLDTDTTLVHYVHIIHWTMYNIPIHQTHEKTSWINFPWTLFKECERRTQSYVSKTGSPCSR